MAKRKKYQTAEQLDDSDLARHLNIQSQRIFDVADEIKSSAPRSMEQVLRRAEAWEELADAASKHAVLFREAATRAVRAGGMTAEQFEVGARLHEADAAERTPKTQIH